MNKLKIKTIALTLLAALIVEMAAPAALLALTSGPVQPEFTDFEPVATTSMVNEFTGDFTYNLPIINIPGANGGGYAMSLSYHSGMSPEQEASWVGYGWNLNPGAIVRGKRGTPDDAYGDEATYYNKNKPNITYSAGLSLGVEFFSKDVPGLSEINELLGGGDNTNIGGLSYRYAIRVNTYKGFGYTTGFSAHIAGLVRANYSMTDGKSQWEPVEFNPMRFLSQFAYNWLGFTPETNKSDVKQKTFLQRYAMKAIGGAAAAADHLANYYASHSYSDELRPINIGEYTGSSTNFSLGFQYMIAAIIGPQAQFTGNRTWQENKATRTLKNWGYMYSGHAYSDRKAVMDYYMEKELPFDLRDKLMAIPFSNADNFGLSGEGLGGGFRLFHARAGHFRPSFRQSKLKIVQDGFELGAGAGQIEAGKDVGTGESESRLENWQFSSEADYTDYQFATQSAAGPTARIDEPWFFRFNNDMGGCIEFDNSDEPRRLAESSEMPVQLRSAINDQRRSQRSTHIAYHTNEEIAAGKAYTPASYSPSTNANIDLQNIRTLVPKGIGEFVFHNQQGARYIYGLPVYSALEQNLQYGTRMFGVGPNLEVGSDKYLASYATTSNVTGPEDATYVTGEVRDAPYAGSMLLTEITTPDYLDRTGNGPSVDDFGGYVRFNYLPCYAGAAASATNADTYIRNNWFKWRTPYAGMLYNQNDLVEPHDDGGVVQNGYKQIYYLQSVETKTHRAEFITSDREDGMDAAVEADALVDKTAQGSRKLRKLDKIYLYAKGIDGAADKLLKTVHFDYDYSLMENQPNGINGAGKLTLKKVWFEYEGIVNTRITPYVFGYEYRTPAFYNNRLPKHFRTKYKDEIVTWPGNNLDTKYQNPPYSPFNIDAWGNYQYAGQNRYSRKQSWVNQNPPPEQFDPAAWHLKWIRLPSGGELHVQYEQHDYCYVQDRHAMAMIPLHSANTDGSGNKFYLDVKAALGDDVSEAELERMSDLIKRKYFTENDEIYTKFLYSVYANEIPDIHNPALKANYISGYTKLWNQEYTGGVPVWQATEPVGIEEINGENLLWVVLRHRPRTSCVDYVEHNVAGRDDLEEIGNQAQSYGTRRILEELFTEFGSDFYDENTGCKKVAWQDSYIRLPILRAKKGGGVRVKRLFMVDAGIEHDQTNRYGAVYGSEYLYVTKSEDSGTLISSGVATNEPGSMREENALVVSLKNELDPATQNRWTTSRDKEQFEGPIGESLLPAPTIGYSRVVVKNIHESASGGNGFTVHEYFTAKDYPFDHRYEHLNLSGVNKNGIVWDNDHFTLPLVLYQQSHENIKVLQGYSFILNNMHGQMRSTFSYGGDIDADPGTWTASSGQIIEYYEPGEKVPMFYGNDKPFRYEQPGKEMELVFESRHLRDRTNDWKLEVDLSILFAGIPWPIPTLFPTVHNNGSNTSMHVSSKVIRYPVIRKSVTTVSNKLKHTSEYLAFDPATGAPVLTRTSDGFDGLTLQGQVHNGSYHSYQYPAYRDYRELGQKSANERLVLRSAPQASTSGTIFSLSTGSEPTLSINSGKQSRVDYILLEALYPGDVVELRASTSAQIFQVGEILNPGNTPGNIRLYEMPGSATTLADGPIDEIEVIKSGRRNNLAAPSGSVLTYGEDKSAALAWAAELDSRQALADKLNDHFLRNKKFMGVYHYTEGLQGKALDWSLFTDIAGAPDSSALRPLDPEYAFSFVLSDDKQKITVTPKRVTCNDTVNVHPTVDALNAALENLWGRAVTTASLGGTACADYVEHRPTAGSIHLATVQEWIGTSNAQIAGAANLCSPLPLSEPSLDAVPCTINYLYSETQATFLQKSGGPPRLASLCIRDGNQKPILQCYVQKDDNCNLEWGCIPNPETALFPNLYSIGNFTGTSASVSMATLVGDATQQASFTQSIGRFGQNNQGYLFFDCYLTQTRHIYTYAFHHNVYTYGIASGEPTVLERDKNGPGYFAIDDDGQLVYFQNENSTPSTIASLRFANTGIARINAGPEPATVLNADALTYSDDWQYSTMYGSGDTDNPYADGRRGKWRLQSSYAYREDIADARSASNRVYTMGTMASFSFFDRNNISQSLADGWLTVNTVTAYSPHGEALEEQNILGIPSAAKFAYKGMMPVLVARNAEKNAVFFESFEDKADAGSGTGVYSAGAHAGHKHYRIETGGKYSCNEISLSPRLKQQGLRVKFWVYTPNFTNLGANLQVQISGAVAFPTPQLVARTGEWALFETMLEPAALASLTTGEIQIDITMANYSYILLDDVRIQPLDASMICYVYDANTLRLLATMDDQHFGLYYQYSAEGKLLRKLRETERGLLTIVEAHNHTPMVERSEAFTSASVSVIREGLEKARQYDNNMIMERNTAPLNGSAKRGKGTGFEFNEKVKLPSGPIQQLQEAVDSVNNKAGSIKQNN